MPNRVIEAVLESAGIQPCYSISMLPCDPGSRVAVVRCPEGTYILKGHRAEMSRPVLENQLRLRQLLRKNGFSFLPPVLNLGLEARVLEYEGCIWSLESYVEADRAFDWKKDGWSREHCGSASRLLAALHTAGFHLVQSGEHPLLPTANSSFFRDSLLLCRQRVEVVATKSVEPIWKRVGTEMPSIAQLVEECLATVDSLLPLPMVVVHGDYHPGNILFCGGVATTLLDMEYASIGSPLVDLAYACIMFFADRACPSGIDYGAVRRFLADYKQALPEAMPWRNWSENPAGKREFDARCLLSVYLILLWAVNGAYDHRSGFLEGDRSVHDSTRVSVLADSLTGRDDQADGGFEYGAELALTLLAEGVSLVEGLLY